MPADLHVHTCWCGHGYGTMEAYVQAALARHLPEIGFTVHLPIPIPCDHKATLDEAEMDLYVEEIARLRRRYGDQIAIRQAAEADFYPGAEPHIERILARWPAEYVIGSVHFLGDWLFDHPKNVSEFDRWDLYALYEEYFGLVEQAIASGLFDVIGHLDLIKKFGHRPSRDIGDILERVADRLVEADLCTELNTAGKDKPVGEMYPSEQALQILRARQVPLILGSDAHRPEEVGRYFGEAVALLRRVGYRELVRFEGRRRQMVALD